MNKLRLLLSIAILLFPAFSLAQSDGLAAKVKEHTFANGLKLLMVERHSSPTVAAWVRFKVGSVNERSDERGIAHMLEHMLFKGTKTIGTKNYGAEAPLLDRIEETAEALMAEQRKRENGDQKLIKELARQLGALQSEEDQYVVPDEYAELFARNGGVGFNAFTAKDTTAYMINLPANKLELWAAIQADRMRNPVLRQFYTERNVVMEERRRSYDAEPAGKLWENFLAAAFVVHPYGQPVIGWPSDIENLSRTKAEGFLHSYYAPNNAIVAIIGDIDPSKTIALVEKYFATIPPGAPVTPVADEEPAQGGERRIEIIGDAEPELLIGFHKPTLPSADDYVFDVIEMLLANGKASRLYKRLVVEKQLAAEVSAAVVPGSLYPNLFIVSATPRAPHTLKEVEEAIYAELARLKSEPVTERELKRIANNLEASEIHSMGSNGGLAYQLTEYEATAGTWRYFFEHRQKVAKVTADDVQRVAKKYLVQENRTVGFITKKVKTSNQ